jgi:hypothetical protein
VVDILGALLFKEGWAGIAFIYKVQCLSIKFLPQQFNNKNKSLIINIRQKLFFTQFQVLKLGHEIISGAGNWGLGLALVWVLGVRIGIVALGVVEWAWTLVVPTTAHWVSITVGWGLLVLEPRLHLMLNLPLDWGWRGVLLWGWLGWVFEWVVGVGLIGIGLLALLQSSDAWELLLLGLVLARLALPLLGLATVGTAIHTAWSEVVATAWSEVVATAWSEVVATAWSEVVATSKIFSLKMRILWLLGLLSLFAKIAANWLEIVPSHKLNVIINQLSIWDSLILENQTLFP